MSCEELKMVKLGRKKDKKKFLGNGKAKPKKF
jgi:hypothetical protein